MLISYMIQYAMTVLPANCNISLHLENSITLMLTHWGRVTHTCVSELTTIGSDNGLSPGRRQAIIWNNAGLLLIEPLRTNFSEISIGIQTFSFKKMHLNMSSEKRRPFCLGLNVLMEWRVLPPVSMAYLRKVGLGLNTFPSYDMAWSVWIAVKPVSVAWI